MAFLSRPGALRGLIAPQTRRCAPLRLSPAGTRGQVARLCDSAELRRQLGERNRQVAERMFSIANIDMVEEILVTAIDAPTANSHRG